jgi:hypothetical protein
MPFRHLKKEHEVTTIISGKTVTERSVHQVIEISKEILAIIFAAILLACLLLRTKQIVALWESIKHIFL